SCALTSYLSVYTAPLATHRPCFVFLTIRRPPTPTLFPYTTLFRSLRRPTGTSRRGPGCPVRPNVRAVSARCCWRSSPAWCSRPSWCCRCSCCSPATTVPAAGSPGSGGESGVRPAVPGGRAGRSPCRRPGARERGRRLGAAARRRGGDGSAPVRRDPAGEHGGDAASAGPGPGEVRDQPVLRARPLSAGRLARPGTALSAGRLPRPGHGRGGRGRSRRRRRDGGGGTVSPVDVTMALVVGTLFAIGFYLMLQRSLMRIV